MSFSLKQIIGRRAEKQACAYLRSQGLRLLLQNYLCHWGEIDIIMEDRDEIVFVEVRTRSGHLFGTALESINLTKQKKIIKAAQHFLKCKRWLHTKYSRFDIVTIQHQGKYAQFEWIKNAIVTD